MVLGEEEEKEGGWGGGTAVQQRKSKGTRSLANTSKGTDSLANMSKGTHSLANMPVQQSKTLERVRGTVERVRADSSRSIRVQANKTVTEDQDKTVPTPPRIRDLVP